ncbi:MAG: hypothetical protein ACLGXA_17630 [Acidobacteriota bacterium]
MHNELLVLSRDRDCVSDWQTGVSLHSHTRHSQESLEFIGAFLRQRPATRKWFEAQKECCRRVTGIELDFDRAYWTPPLCERMAQDVELRQIEQLGLRPMVSLTDHNSIEACLLLRKDAAFPDVPISTEWTVPFGKAVFHFGIHHLPPADADSIMAAMHEATFLADEDRILRLFAEISRIPEVLVVFNHPLWNFYKIPQDQFMYDLTRFLEAGNRYVHALELNGMRSHAENRGVLRLTADWNQILISGGDRHGCEPNASLNLTNAADFSEFVDEVREGRQSTVLVMPQYAVPLGWRLYQNFTHVVAEYPDHPEGRRLWDERTFHPDRSGGVVPMRRLWKSGEAPDFLKGIFGAAMTAGLVPFHKLLGLWNRSQNESLRLADPPSWTLRGAGAGGTRDAALEECLYGGGEPAAD